MCKKGVACEAGGGGGGNDLRTGVTFASLVFSQRCVSPRHDTGSLDNPFPTFRKNTVVLVSTVQAFEDNGVILA
jgi:hypothetical protein